MIEIKNIIFTKNKISALKCFLCFINYILPLRLKFLNETYIALLDGKKIGQITLDKDSKSSSRFKITKLILEEYSSLIAKQLVNYVISKYSAQGAQFFYAVVDENQPELLNVFKNELNFRLCASEYLYKIKLENTSRALILSPFKREFLRDISNFYNENINSFNRPFFSRQNYQFLNGCSKYIFYNHDKNKILGYFEVATKNNLDYYINFSIDFEYNIYLMDSIKFIYAKLSQKNKKFNLYIKVKDYFMNSKELLNILKENNMEFISKSQILAKDCYKEIKADDILKSVKIIFNDPTLA